MYILSLSLSLSIRHKLSYLLTLSYQEIKEIVTRNILQWIDNLYEGMYEHMKW